MGEFDNIKIEDVKLSTGEEAPVETPVATQVEQTPVETQPAVEAPVKDIETELVSNPYEFIEKDEFLKGLVDFYKKTGDVTPYLQAKTVDFTKMTDEDVMRRELREQYPDVSDKAFDRLYKQQVLDKFKLDADEWGDEDSELGRELLKVEASKLREKFLGWQKQYQAPVSDVEKAQLEEQERIVNDFKKFEEDVKLNPVTQSIISDKRIVVKTADGEFNYELQTPEVLLDMTVDNTKFFNQFANHDGKLDYDRWYKTAAYSQNPEQFEKSLINFGKTLGRAEVTKEIKNPSTTQLGDVPTETAGDFKTGLLQAFASRGVKK
jgi:hypothetical protein